MVIQVIGYREISFRQFKIGEFAFGILVGILGIKFDNKIATLYYYLSYLEYVL